MRFLDQIKETTNGIEAVFSTHYNYDRTSVFLYSQQDGSFGPTTPTLEDYGHTLPEFSTLNTTNVFFKDPNSDNVAPSVYDVYNTYKLANFPNYDTNKLTPLKLNNNNFLINKLGKNKFTWLTNNTLPTPFRYNGYFNAAGGYNNSSVCYLNLPFQGSGIYTGPRYFLISNDTVMTANHFIAGLEQSIVDNQTVFSIIGSDDSIYYYKCVDFTNNIGDDIVLFKIVGVAPNPIENGISSGAITPISTPDYNVNYNSKLYAYLNSCPKFIIDQDFKLGYCIESFLGMQNFSLSISPKVSNFCFNTFSNFITMQNISDLNITIDDMMGATTTGDSSSPSFILYKNKQEEYTPILIRTKNGVSDQEGYDLSVYNKIDNAITDMNCELRNKIIIPEDEIDLYFYTSFYNRKIKRRII
jgi:hypothetical protein